MPFSIGSRTFPTIDSKGNLGENKILPNNAFIITLFKSGGFTTYGSNDALPGFVNNRDFYLHGISGEFSYFLSASPGIGRAFTCYMRYAFYRGANIQNVNTTLTLQPTDPLYNFVTIRESSIVYNPPLLISGAQRLYYSMGASDVDPALVTNVTFGINFICSFTN